MKSVYLTFAIATSSLTAAPHAALAEKGLDQLAFIQDMKSEAKQAYTERLYSLADERHHLYKSGMAPEKRHQMRTLIHTREQELQHEFQERMANLIAMEDTIKQNLISGHIQTSHKSYKNETAANAATYLAQSDAARRSYAGDHASFVMP